MDFDKGFEDGWNKEMQNANMFLIPPIAPVPPVGSDGSYQSGFAEGAAAAIISVSDIISMGDSL